MAKNKLKIRNVPYDSRSDGERIRSQWRKLTGLHKRNEPSAAIVRAATAAELSVNLAIRAEFAAQSNLTAATVDGLMRKANGLWGKMAGLLLPLLIDRPNEEVVKKLCRASDKINRDRNDIIHSGKFSSRANALKAIERCRTFSTSLVQLYEPDFKLPSLSPDALRDPSSEAGAKSKAKVKPKVKLSKGRKLKR